MFVGKLNNSIACETKDFSPNNRVEEGSFSKAMASIKNDSGYDNLFLKAEKEWGIPAGLLKAIGKAESNFNPNAVSQAGAQGIMQLMPATGRSLGVTNPFEPEENINAAAKYLRSLLDRYQGDVKLALAAYNAGSGNVEKYQGVPPFKETERYLEKILGTADQGTLPVRVNEALPSPSAQRETKQEEVGSQEYLRYLIELNLIWTVLDAEEKEIPFFEERIV